VIALDTGGLYALLDSSDGYHGATVAAIDGYDGPLLLSPLILAETDYLVSKRLGRRAERTFLAEVTDKVYRLVGFDDDDMQSAADVVNTYGDMDIGIADASVAVIAGRYRTVDLLSVDGHFRAINPLWGTAFRLLPLDS
jgi:predicted nucleic acid-binding protein